MTIDGLPASGEPPIPEDVRQRGVELLQRLLTSGKVDLNRFNQALDELFAAGTEGELAAVVRSLPPPVAFTSPGRRRQEPLEISTGMGEVRLDGRWQVGRCTTIRTGMGSVTVDLTEAEFDDWDVEIAVHTSMGSITVIAPRGLDVRLVGRNSPVSSVIEPPFPGFPVVRLSATSDMGEIRVVHPRHQKDRHRRRLGRGKRDSTRPD